MATSEETFGLASRWGWVVFRGVIAIVFGLVAFARPGAMTLALVLLFGAYAFIGGIAAIVSAIHRGREGDHWGMLLLDGVLGIVAAVVAVLWPGAAALGFVWVIGAWAVLAGCLEIASAISLRKLIDHEWTLGLAGAVSIVFGILMLYRPVAGGLAMVWILGAYAVAFGVLMIALGLRLRHYAPSHAHPQMPHGLPQPG
jgi:uncharacterized membrane protein HdeD (DUF308 family)